MIGLLPNTYYVLQQARGACKDDETFIAFLCMTVALAWGQVRVPHPLDARRAHAMRPAPAVSTAKRRPGEDGVLGGNVAEVVLDEGAVLAEMAAMGAGLVEGCMVKLNAHA